MSIENKELMKHFASILRKRANADQEAERKIDPVILRHLSRKDIVTIVTEIYKGELPTNVDMALQENEELLELIHDDLFIISHILNEWCRKLSGQTKLSSPEGK